jgi:outer membrane protein OmpA-like peptidoglycan-associated protein
MPRISPFLWATTLIFAASTSVFGMPASGKPMSASAALDTSFNVFFDPGAASLSNEGRKIISVAAMRFAATHSRHSAAHILLDSETDDQDRASLSTERIRAVSTQLVRDGIQRKFVSAVQHSSGHPEPVSLREWQTRRISISIQENPVVARLVD